MTARILVINDSQEILDLFRLILEVEQYEVQVSIIAFENATDIEHIAPNLIILDVLIGRERGGWQLLQKLKGYAPTASIPVILCTAAVQTIREQEAYLQYVGVSVVVKPFDIDDFLVQVRQSLQSPLIHR